MADTKISALPSATTPLAGTEVLPLVQAGGNVKVAVSDLTAGRAVSALSFAGPLNGTVGATTPTTGAFTTLSATGRSGVTMSGQISAISLGQVSTDPTYGLLSFNGAFAATTLAGMWGGGGSNDLLINVPTSGGIYSRVNNSTVTLLSSTGLAVTGTLSATTPIGTASGGTGLGGATPFTSGGVVYASSSSALATGSALTFDGNTFTANANGAVSGIFNRNTSNGKTLDIQLLTQSVGWLGSNSNGDFVITSTVGGLASNNLIFANSNGTEAMRLTSSSLYTASGINVGIGLSNPTVKLDVSGTAANIARFISSGATTSLALDNTNANAWGSNIGIFTGGTAAGYFGTIGSLLGTTAQDLAVYATAGNSFRVYTNGNNERMRLDSSGNLGIGTSLPAAKLDVNGGALIQGLTVGLGAGAVATNTAVGYQAQNATATLGSTTAIGYQAAYSNTGAEGLTYVGRWAGYSTTTGSNNTTVGVNSLFSNTTGANNTAHGHSALFSNTTASNNTAVGYQAGYANTTAAGNVALGYLAGYSTTTGTGQNTSAGSYAFYANTTGYYNSAFGSEAMYYNTTGVQNTAVGKAALGNNTTASNNTAVGFQAGYTNTTGDVTAVGRLAMYSNTTGVGSTAMGLSALYSNNTGAYNTAFGYSALYSNTTASNNTAVGYQAGYSNQTAIGAVFIGYQAGYGSVGISTTINYNTAVGNQAGYALTSGYGNTFLGNGSGNLVTTGYKNTILGTYSGNQGGLDIRTASNYIVLSDGDGNPRGVFDSSGNLGIGTSSPVGRLEAVGGTGAGFNGWFRTGDATAANNAGGGFYNTSSATAASRRAVLALDADGANLGGGDYFVIEKSGNSGTADLLQYSNASMRFGTNYTNRATFDMTLDTSGNLLVGTANSAGTSGVGVAINPTANGVRAVSADSTGAAETYSMYSTGASAYRFYVDWGGTISATSIVITAISDQRLKENVRDIDTGLGAIMALKPRRFDWKEGKGQNKKNAAGFIAQEFEIVFPECVSTSKAGEDGIQYKNINHETLIPTLVKAIQEQQAVITQLIARVAQLESKP